VSVPLRCNVRRSRTPVGTSKGAAVWAIGECAQADGQVYGLVAPCFSMAEVTGDPSAQLELMPGDVAGLRRAVASLCAVRLRAWNPGPIIRVGYRRDAR